jgi:hypothetical protein
MNSLTNKLSVLFIATLLLATACNRGEEDPDDGLEQETITTIVLKFTETGTNNTLEFTWEDLDGPGGNAPVIDPIVLANDKTYDLAIELFDKTDPNDIEDITEEIEEEDDEHQFFFQGTAVGSRIRIQYADQDGDGNPVGLKNTVTTLSTGTGTFIITLRHELNKNATGVSAGDITNAGGDTDVEATFQLTVQ